VTNLPARATSAKRHNEKKSSSPAQGSVVSTTSPRGGHFAVRGA